VPTVPGDVEDDDGDDEPNDRVSDGSPESDDTRAGKDAEADEAINTSMVAVCDESGTVEALARVRANLRCDFVADEADHARRRQPPQVCECVRVNEAKDRLTERHDGTDEDSHDDGDPSPPLASGASEEEGEPERDRGQRISEVVNQVGQ